MSPTYWNIYGEELINKTLEGMDGVIIGERRITVIKYAHDQIVLASSEEDLNIMNRVVIIQIMFRMKINVIKVK